MRQDTRDPSSARLAWGCRKVRGSERPGPTAVRWALDSHLPRTRSYWNWNSRSTSVARRSTSSSSGSKAHFTGTKIYVRPALRVVERSRSGPRCGTAPTQRRRSRPAVCHDGRYQTHSNLCTIHEALAAMLRTWQPARASSCRTDAHAVPTQWTRILDSRASVVPSRCARGARLGGLS